MTDLLVALTGSTTRAYTLAILAGSRVPQTGYRIARLAGLSAPNVYLALRRLSEAGLVRQRVGGWVLVNEKVRSLCEGQGPLFERRFSLSEKIRAGRSQPVTRRRAPAYPRGTPRPSASARRLLREFSRSPTKNSLLRAAGLRESQHKVQ
jgi:DNA-binding transcriptional ArsR family regulator